jgi:protein-L-isoaspartate(D-aspartate) O-methyltransferase
MPFFISASAARRLLAGLIVAATGAMDVSAQDRFEADRRRMLEEIERNTRDTQRETGRAILSARVLEAMRRVPRHRLVPPGDEANAYRDRPLSIGLGQTISQPSIVALMTDLAEVKPNDKVLEIGTGSGYQAAVLAELGARVYTVEILEPLAREAAARLADLGYKNISTRVGDGYLGWSEHAPFDSIVVTAAARSVPPALIEQLKPGGRLVIPVGESSGAQTLYVIEKKPDGQTARRPVLAVRFVPLTGQGQK